MSGSATSKEKKTKVGIENLIKIYGGKIFQTENAAGNTIVIGDRGGTLVLGILACLPTDFLL